MKPSDKSLLSYITLSLFTVGIMLLLIHQLGEVHGLIGTMVILIVQSAELHSRLSAAQREIAALRGQVPESTASERAA
jgi:hypothetical protein